MGFNGMFLLFTFYKIICSTKEFKVCWLPDKLIYFSYFQFLTKMCLSPPPPAPLPVFLFNLPLMFPDNIFHIQ